MKIVLKNLSILNFKGVRNLHIDFENQTNIYGDNATGKTSIFDAFTWLLFGKDSTDRKDFEIKTLDNQNNVIHKLEHEVAATLQVEGEAITLRKTYKEDWTKKRGAETARLTGHINAYFWNDVPMSPSDYQVKINTILKEDLFKLLTNPLYFNQNLKWQDRRNVLMQLAGDISDTDIASGDSAFENLLKMIGGKTFDEFKREIAAKKKIVKEELEKIPTRIDEAHRAMPVAENFDQLEVLISKAETDLANVITAIKDSSQAQKQILDQKRHINNEIYQLQTKSDNLKNTLRSEIDSEIKNGSKATDDLQRQKAICNTELVSKQAEITQKQAEISRAEQQIELYKNEMSSLRNKWNEVNHTELKFNDADFCCPTCKRAFEQQDVDSSKEELSINFNNNKSAQLAKISDDGKYAKEQHEVYAQRREELQSELNVLVASLSELNKSLEEITSKITVEAVNKPQLKAEELLGGRLYAHPQYQAILAEVKDLQAQRDALTEAATDGELLAKEIALRTDIKSYETRLANKQQIENITQRIIELENSEKALAQTLASLEGTEYTMLCFTKAKIDEMEKRINSKFQLVKFKLFHQHIEGGEKEVCDTLVNGVPFNDVNTAGKLQAGIDIINTLSEHYGVSAPIFLDNRESVVMIPDTDSQLVNLYVVEGAKLSVGEIQYEIGFKQPQAA